MPTKMVYTTSLRLINYIASCNSYIFNCSTLYFDKNLKEAIDMFILELERLNVLDKRLMNNEKNCSISLFNNTENRITYFGDVYSINYQASWACLVQAQRHGTIDYELKRLDNKKYFITPILDKDEFLKNKWLNDIKSVSNIILQGELIQIHESGKYEDFILKCKERLCSATQLEIIHETYLLLLNYKHALDSTYYPLKDDIKKYTLGMHCTFPDFKCSNPICMPKINHLIEKYNK